VRTTLLPLIGQLLLLAQLHAQEPGPPAPSAREEPLDLGQTEEVDVRLVLIDVVVLDGKDRTVPGLTREDFEIVADGEALPIDTLDTSCLGGPTDDAQAVADPGKRGASAAIPGGRRIVLAFDYLHMSQLQRVDVLEQARRMMQRDLASGDEVMVAALNGGLRIEQPFTTDAAQVAAALRRMQFDITLWQPSFDHLTEETFFAGLHTLFTVLESVQGAKAVVLFSSHPGRSDTDDLRFASLAAAATTSRCSIYTMDSAGLVPPG
jgi:VWFA-related protein